METTTATTAHPITDRVCACCHDVTELPASKINYSVAHVSELPICDCCQHADAVVDGPMKHRLVWAFMCSNCWEINGAFPGKVGVGKGQRLEVMS